MKLTLLTPALAAILGLALAGAPTTLKAQTAPTPAPAATSTAPAATPAAKPAKAKKTASDKKEYKGTIAALDAAASTITLSGKTPKTLVIASTTKIKKDGKPATLADFAVGEKVTGSYTTDATGKLTAASLYTKTKAAVATAKPAAKPATVAPAAAAPASNPAPAGQ